MDLNIIWFILIAVLYTGFFVLEGFDFGVGILLPFLSKTDGTRRLMYNAIGPTWDANEVWLVLAGGATFAAFPQWYATLFSGFYIPLFLVLLGLILRGVSFEFRGKMESRTWRSFWDYAMFGGSIIVPLLMGVAFANILQGVPIDGKMNYSGGFWNLLNPFALLGGLTFVGLAILLGALFLKLKTGAPLSDEAEKAIRAVWLPALILTGGFCVFAVIIKSGTNQPVTAGIIAAVVAVFALISSMIAFRSNRQGWSLGLGIAAMASISATIFALLFPNVMVSSTDPSFSLTIYTAASSVKTLNIMSIVVLIFLPIALAYQAYNYWIFRKRITTKSSDLHY